VSEAADSSREEDPMNHDALIEQYLAGPGLLRRAVVGMTGDQLLARPVPGRWSSLEVVCHLADYEPIYADRMKRVIALREPDLLPGDPDDHRLLNPFPLVRALL
jgi:hypothetical protein